MKEGTIENTRFKELIVGLQEINIRVHGSFIKSLMDYIESLRGLLSDEVITPFISSNLMANYTKLINIFAGVDKLELQ